MRTFNVDTPILSMDLEIGEVEITLTEADVRDLNDGHSITTLTTQGEEIALFPSL